MKCRYYNTCPSCTAWCNNGRPSPKCVDFILSAYFRLKRDYEDLQDELGNVLDEDLSDDLSDEELN